MMNSDGTKIHFIGEVKLDFSAYDGQDNYSDGGIEEEILLHVKAGNEENFLRSDDRFHVLYYLSPMRHFLVEWLPIKENDTVLEIGCGCGALTGTLLKKGAIVEAVELSPRRAKICALRNWREKNLTIHVGNLNAMTFDKKFDFVLLIGVFEYSEMFTHTKNPQIDFLNKCKSFLKPNGALVIAIENRLGLEYLSGAAESHTGKLFDGITDYQSPIGVKTFSRLELKNMLNSCGFVEQKFFYPYPDYKFPYIIHSDEMLPTNSDFTHFGDFFYDVNRAQLFSLWQALPTVINAGLYQDLANSFLIVAQQNHESQRVFPVKIFANNRLRKPKYQLRTEIHNSPSGLVVKKIARNPLAREHLKAMVENCKIFSEVYGAEHVAQMKLISEDVAEMEYITGIPFEDYLCQILGEGNVNEFVESLTFYFQNILRGTNDNQKFSDDIVSFNSPDRRYQYDLNFHNIFICDGDFVVLDYEFLLPILPKKFIAFRAFRDFCFKREDFLQKHGLSLESLIKTLELSPETLQEYQIQNLAIYHAFSDDYDERYQKKRLLVKSFNF